MANAIDIFEERPALYDFTSNPPTPLGILIVLQDRLKPWSADGKFFRDPMGARQGMWTMMHLMTIHNQVWSLGRQMDFYKKIVMHWNPCPTCRKRYWYDMEKIVKESESA